MTIRQRLIHWIAARRPCRVIHGPNDEPYLERYFLFSMLGVTAYLHRFVASDPERGLHDHPWGWSLSWILDGTYYEERLTEVDGKDHHVEFRLRTPGQFNRLRGDDFHRIILRRYSEPVWTLFIHGPRRKGWGFVTFRDYRAGGGIFRGPIQTPYTRVIRRLIAVPVKCQPNGGKTVITIDELSDG